MGREQVPEQRGEDTYIGPPGAGHDFDCFLYEDMGFSFLERDIGSENFWRHREDIHVSQVIKSLKIMREHCDRVSDKLELILRIKRDIVNPRYIPEPGDRLFVPDVSVEENVQGVAIKGGLATVLDGDGLGKIFFYDFPEVPFRISHILKNQMEWMDKYGMQPAARVDDEFPEEPEPEKSPEKEADAVRVSESDDVSGIAEVDNPDEITDSEEIREIDNDLNGNDDGEEDEK
jgi:hypothetical protein